MKARSFRRNKKNRSCIRHFEQKVVNCRDLGPHAVVGGGVGGSKGQKVHIQEFESIEISRDAADDGLSHL